MKTTAAEALLIVSPFLAPIVIRFFWARQRQPFERAGKTLAIFVFWLSSLACLFIANFSWVLFWWNIVAYVLIFPFAGRYTRPITLGAHIGWGILVNTFMTVTYSFVPVLLLFGMSPGMETEGAYGWPKIAEQVTAAQAQYDADFLATNTAQSASQLAFTLDNPDVIALSPKRDGYHDWFDPATRVGQSAILLEHPDAEEDWKQRFETITPIGNAPAVVWGRTLRDYRLYFVEGFKLPP